MVGIPRSKGCTTCRRRKIRCDETKPNCNRCTNSGRVCEGYERYSVFICRTDKGLSRRKYLEEARPRRESVEVQQPNIWKNSVIAWLLAEQEAGHDSWLRFAAELQNPIPVLQKSLLALSLIRFGRLTRNYDVVLQGKSVYGECLVLAQRALYDSRYMYHDETFGSIRAMSLYELFESTSDDPSAWQNHLSGITHLVQARGPNSHQSPLARAVLKDVRYALMLKALMYRKETLFGRNEWMLDWNDPEHQFYDLGFQLARVLEASEREGHDPSAYDRIHTHLALLDGRLTDPMLRVNWLSCRLFLNIVSRPLGLVWATVEEAERFAGQMLDMLPKIIDTKWGHRCLFPLSCLTWHYRNESEEFREIQRLRSSLSQGKQVRFPMEKYETRVLGPMIASQKDRRPMPAGWQ